MASYAFTDQIAQDEQRVTSSRQNSGQLMAAPQSQTSQQNNSYLSANQQDLLLAALNSQATGRQNSYPPVSDRELAQDSVAQQSTMNGVNDSGLYMSPQDATLDAFGDYSPDLDYLGGDSFDFENADLGGEMIGALPGDLINGTDLHEKRKNSDDDDGTEEGDAKRHESQEGEKSAKKPGRKPLTSEPTTKRKAQNRAAQRAFRERKEQHLKDLETRVSELTKAQEADKHENGLLKAQVERLQVELREYRKRLSLNGSSSANRSPPAAAYGPGRSNSNSSTYGNSFQFDFPKFGGLPGSQIFGQALSNGSGSAQRTSATPPSMHSPKNGSFSGPSQPAQYGSRQNSMGRSMSPNSTGGTNTGSPAQTANVNGTFATYSTNDNMHGFAATLPTMGGSSNDPFGDLFSPSILKSASVDSNSGYFPTPTQGNGTRSIDGIADPNGGDSTAGLNRVFQFNSNSSGGSDTASPSASSASQWNGNANSSTGTSPEPSHGSPANKAMDKFNTAQRHQSPLATTNQSASNNTVFSSPDYGLPSLDSFDPVLFGDYRDSQDAIVGGGDFTGGFFDEALQPFDYNSPTNLFGILQSPQLQSQQLQVNSGGVVNAPTPSKNLMAEIDKTRDGGDDDYGLPQTQKSRPLSSDEGKFISCNNIWNQLQTNPDFQEGKFDLDSLCSELKAKARCSESGVLVDQEHVDAALRKLGKKDEKGKAYDAPSTLMFEQESWDNVLKKLGHNKPERSAFL